MRGALVVVDMLEDSLGEGRSSAITPHGRAIVPCVNELGHWARGRGWPVVFACDSFLPGDFIFRGKLKPCSLRGTPGAEPYAGLERRPDDLVVPKRRFSAFFKTDLDQTLRSWQVDTAIVCGISTPVCVLATALDAVSHDLRAVIVADATAAASPEAHAAVLGLYRDTPLFPLLRVMTARELREEAT